MLEFLKKIYSENLELINFYRSNFTIKESFESESYIINLKYFINNFFICDCIWKNTNNLCISTSSISPCYISASSISTSQFPLIFFAVLLEELKDFNVVYFLTNENKIKKIKEKFCSATIISIELDGRFEMDVVGIRGSLEECDLHKFPLVYFNP